MIPSFSYYSYNGNVAENVAATFDNSLIHAGNDVIFLANSISVGAQYTWNNGPEAYLNTQIDATRQFAADTWSGIQNAYNYVTTTPNAQQWKDLGNYLSNPDNIAKLGAAAIEAYAMGKISNALTRSATSSATTKVATSETELAMTETIPGRVQSRINISNKGWEHTVERHFSTKNASQFTISQDELKSMLQSKDIVNTRVARTLDMRMELGMFERLM